MTGREEDRRDMEVGVMAISTIAGFIWATILSNSSNGPFFGIFGGLSVGAVLVLTARLAATK